MSGDKGYGHGFHNPSDPSNFSNPSQMQGKIAREQQDQQGILPTQSNGYVSAPVFHPKRRTYIISGLLMLLVGVVISFADGDASNHAAALGKGVFSLILIVWGVVLTLTGFAKKEGA